MTGTLERLADAMARWLAAATEIAEIADEIEADIVEGHGTEEDHEAILQLRDATAAAWEGLDIADEIIRKLTLARVEVRRDV